MLRVAALAVAHSLSGVPSHADFTDIVSLGSATYSIEDSASSGAYSQNAAGVRFNPSVALGDTVGGTFAPTNWTSFTGLTNTIYLKLSFVGANPFLPVTLEIFNSDFSQSNAYLGTTTPIAGSSDYFKFEIIGSSIPAVIGDAAGAQITWDGDAPIDVTIHSIATESSVPQEPVGGTFTARAPGGVRFLTSSGLVGAQLPPGAPAWSSLSDSNAKTEIQPLDHGAILSALSKVNVDAWRYKHAPERRCIGPMAQDFHAAFGLGNDDKHISSMDADGVALSALKGLIRKFEERKNHSATQARCLDELEAQLEAFRLLLQIEIRQPR
jgi:hypothetical protein